MAEKRRGGVEGVEEEQRRRWVGRDAVKKVVKFWRLVEIHKLNGDRLGRSNSNNRLLDAS